VYGRLPVVQQLTDYVFLAQDTALTQDRVVTLARIFYALRLSMQELRVFYENLKLEPTMSRFFPHITSVPTTEGPMSFSYVEPLDIDEGCVTFLVRLDNGKNAVVKFAERYGIDAHKILAAQGRAPRLFHAGTLDTQEQSYGGRFIIVMEHFEGSTLLNLSAGTPVVADVRNAVKESLAHLHQAGFVHGDIRPPNIVVVDGEGPVGPRTRIIDFDWAGLVGEAVYPLNISDVFYQVLQVQELDRITAEHDLKMADRL
jgi:serine/threonine protein kinase